MKICYELYTTAGNVRKNNQDNYYLNGYLKQTGNDEDEMSGTSESGNQVFAVCDGMGGIDSGEIASEIAVRMLRELCLEQSVFNWERYIQKVNHSICQYQKEQQISMGTTFAGLSVSSSKVIAVNVGDSRIYQIRKGKIRQLSRDHNEYQMMLEAGIKADDRTIKMSRCRLTQFLGIPKDLFDLEPHIVEESVIEGDIYLLCSDGLYGVLSDHQMLDMIKKGQNSDHLCKKMAELAKYMGSRDNITVMLVYFGEKKKRMHLFGKIFMKHRKCE